MTTQRDAAGLAAALLRGGTEVAADVQPVIQMARALGLTKSTQVGEAVWQLVASVIHAEQTLSEQGRRYAVAAQEAEVA